MGFNQRAPPLIGSSRSGDVIKQHSCHRRAGEQGGVGQREERFERGGSDSIKRNKFTRFCSQLL